MRSHYRKFENIKDSHCRRFMFRRLEKKDVDIVCGEVTCNVCGYEFVEVQELKLDGSFEEPFICPACNSHTVEFEQHAICKLSEFIKVNLK